MKLTDFLRDKEMLLLLHLVCMCLAAAFLRLTGYSRTNTILFLTLWLLLLAAWLWSLLCGGGNFSGRRSGFWTR